MLDARPASTIASIEATGTGPRTPPQAADFDAVAREWAKPSSPRLWRRHSDAVNRRLVERWLPAGPGALLKTDLFDEAVGEGLVGDLGRRSWHVTGIDFSEVVIDAARADRPDLDACRADVRRLPFDDVAFDAVFSNSTLDHFGRREEIDLALGELARVLRPGGTLVLTLDNLRNPLVALRSVLPRRLLQGLRVVPYYVGPTLGPSGARRAVERAGLKPVEATAVLHCPRVLAVPACSIAERRNPSHPHERLLRSLLGWERLERLPTRTLTGHFVAIRAEKPRPRAG